VLLPGGAGPRHISRQVGSGAARVDVLRGLNACHEAVSGAVNLQHAALDAAHGVGSVIP
jgi:hypothetical protein